MSNRELRVIYKEGHWYRENVLGSLTFISTISLEKVHITRTRDLLLDIPSIEGILHANHVLAILNSLYSTFLSTFT